MKTRRWLGTTLALLTGTAALAAEVVEAIITRPGQITVAEITGQLIIKEAGQQRPAKVDDRVRVDAVVATGRKSLATLAFSNGAVLELGSEAELEVEELLQAPFGSSLKLSALKEEPSISRTRLRLVRGDFRLKVKPLKVARGSVFQLALPAGIARLAEGSLAVVVRMTEAGLGMCTLELERGNAEFEIPGAAPARIPPGPRLGFAVEVDRHTGAVTVGEMPKAAAPPAK